MLPGETYHIFNHANGRENLFEEDKNYLFFLDKVNKYIIPVCRVFSYCLMPNHFHLMVQVRNEPELQLAFVLGNENDTETASTTLMHIDIKKKVSKCFSNLFKYD